MCERKDTISVYFAGHPQKMQQTINKNEENNTKLQHSQESLKLSKHIRKKYPHNKNKTSPPAPPKGFFLVCYIKLKTSKKNPPKYLIVSFSHITSLLCFFLVLGFPAPPNKNRKTLEKPPDQLEAPKTDFRRTSPRPAPWSPCASSTASVCWFCFSFFVLFKQLLFLGIFNTFFWLKCVFFVLFFKFLVAFLVIGHFGP